MKLLISIQEYLQAQSQHTLWLSLFFSLGILWFGWYSFLYQPLVIKTHNIEDRIALCSQACSLYKQKNDSLREHESHYKKMLSLLRDYKNKQADKAFSQNALQDLLHIIRVTQCTFISLTCDTYEQQPFGGIQRARCSFTGAREQVFRFFERFIAQDTLWKITSFSFAMGKEGLVYCTLHLEYLFID